MNTDVMPDVAPTCTATKHGTDRAYRVYRCRCPKAISAHSQWRSVDRRRTDLACRARRHLTIGSYRRGCICRESAEALVDELARQNQRANRRRIEREARNAHLFWRGPNTKVSIEALLMLTTGLPNVRGFFLESTVRERQIAILTLSRRINPMTGYLMTTGEVAEALGTQPEVVRRQRNAMAQLRE